MALWMASQTWGGSGFTIVAADAGQTPDVVQRALAAYDPDHVTGLSYTHQELWDLGLRARPDGSGPAAVEAYARSIGHTTKSDDIATGCSPYRSGRGDMTSREVTSIGTTRRNRHLRVSKPLDSEVEAALANPALPTGLLGLMLGLRSGYLTRPPVPDTAAPMEQLDPHTRGWLGFALGGQPTPRAPGSQGMANPDAWSSTETNLGWVSWFNRLAPHPRRLIVVGDSVDDFALATTWDRMCGHSSAIWIPPHFLPGTDHREVVGNVVAAASLELEPQGGMLVATSATLPQSEVRSYLESALSAARSVAYEEAQIDYVDPDRLVFAPTHQLACVPEDFDIRLTLPTITDLGGGLELAAQIPAQVPRALKVEPGMRPDWQVDVAGVRPRSAVAGRGLAGQYMLAREEDWTVTRSSRAGISFDPLDMGWVGAAASLRQSIAEPMLRFPGLMDWAAAMVAPEYSVALSEAGRRSRTCEDVAGSRNRLIEITRQIHPLLQEFTRPTKADRDFPNHDGLRVAGLGNVVTLAACQRVLGTTTDDTREILDPLLESGLLRRGLVLRCAYCASRDFYALDELAQQYRCRRCANRTDIARSSWTEATTEPTWYYSLHGAYRHLMNNNGDVPLLGVHHLAAKTQHYADIAEIDFLPTDETTASTATEIDVIAAMDGELIIAEAKWAPKAVKGKQSLNKLVHVAATLQADTIMLMAGTSEPWPANVIDHLRSQLSSRKYRGGRRPRLVTLTGLYSSGTEEEH